MATIYWRGDAPAVAQVRNFLLAGTWEATDVITFTIGTKVVTLAAGSTNTTTIAALMATTWNALSSTTYPEFAELTASSSTGNFILTSDTAGKPFAVTIATTETGGGAADAQTIDGGASSTGTSTTANAGPNDLSTLANWSGGALPVNGDTVFIQDSDIDILYSLSALSGVTLAALYIDQSYTGFLGLAKTNNDAGDDITYIEYRERYLVIGATALTIGRGAGNGSPRININNGSVQTALLIYNTGTPESGRDYAVQWKGTHASNVATVIKGTVAIALEPSETATLTVLRVSYDTQPAGDATVYCGIGLTAPDNIYQSGGTLTLNNSAVQVDLNGGECRVVKSLDVLNIDAGKFIHVGKSETLGTVKIGSGGTLDVTQSTALSIDNLEIYENSTYLDPNGVATLGTGAAFPRCAPGDKNITFVTAPHQRWTPSAI